MLFRFLRILLWRRLTRAVAACPEQKHWIEFTTALGLFAAVAIPLGAITGAFPFQPSKEPAPRQLLFVAVAFFRPALFEEIIFRVLIIPHASENADRFREIVWWACSLFLFVVWHPISAWLLKPDMTAIFSSPTFLTCAAFLGVICAALYRRSGSIWPAVLFHWVVVVCWKLLFGGTVSI